MASGDIVEVPFGKVKGKLPTLDQSYIFPNEHFDSVFRSHTKGLKGAGVTTGTFRAFQRILYGSFSWMFIVDIDPDVAPFNRLNYEAIMSAPSLREYLKNFPESFKDRYGKYPPGYDRENYYGDKTSQFPLYQFINEHVGDDGLVKPYRSNRKYLEAFFFNSEAQFQALKRKLRKTNIVLIDGSLTSLELAIKIRSFLKREGIEVSLLDLSNVMDYILANSGNKVTAKNRQQAARLAEFIQTLPFSKAAKLFFTITQARINPIYQSWLRLDGTPVGNDSFRYYVTTPDDVIPVLQGSDVTLKTRPQRLRLSRSCSEFLDLDSYY